MKVKYSISMRSTFLSSCRINLITLIHFFIKSAMLCKPIDTSSFVMNQVTLGAYRVPSLPSNFVKISFNCLGLHLYSDIRAL